MEVRLFLWDVKVTTPRLVFLGLAGLAAQQASGSGGDGLFAHFFVAFFAFGLVIGGLYSSYEDGVIGVLAEAAMDFLCFGFGEYAFTLLNRHSGECQPGQWSLRTFSPLAFPLVFLVMRAFLAPYTAKIVNHVTSDPRTRGPLARVAVVNGLAGLILGALPAVAVAYLLLQILGGRWALANSLIFPPWLIHALGLDHRLPEIADGFVGALRLVAEQHCLPPKACDNPLGILPNGTC
jgi:hypothetical protein